MPGQKEFKAIASEEHDWVEGGKWGDRAATINPLGYLFFEAFSLIKLKKRVNQPHGVTSMKSHSSDFKFKEITSESETIGHLAVLF